MISPIHVADDEHLDGCVATPTVTREEAMRRAAEVFRRIENRLADEAATAANNPTTKEHTNP